MKSTANTHPPQLQLVSHVVISRLCTIIPAAVAVVPPFAGGEDKDEEASITTYQIMSGNQGNAFSIDEKTGYIRVAKPLDYEMIRK